MKRALDQTSLKEIMKKQKLDMKDLDPSKRKYIFPDFGFNDEMNNGIGLKDSEDCC
jgi:hypothetical protein